MFELRSEWRSQSCLGLTTKCPWPTLLWECLCTYWGHERQTQWWLDVFAGCECSQTMQKSRIICLLVGDFTCWQIPMTIFCLRWQTYQTTGTPLLLSALCPGKKNHRWNCGKLRHLKVVSHSFKPSTVHEKGTFIGFGFKFLHCHLLSSGTQYWLLNILCAQPLHRYVKIHASWYNGKN